MIFNFAVLFFLLTISVSAVESLSFTYNGFRSADLSLDGAASIKSNGLLQLTNQTKLAKGHAFYPVPLPIKNSTNGTVVSFSTTFVVAIISEVPTLPGHGLAFVIAPAKTFPGASMSEYFGLFNESNNGNEGNHVFAVELDTTQTGGFSDINNNHVGIDINGLRSEVAKPASYHDGQTGQLRNLSLTGGERIQVWVEYDGLEKKINVTLAPVNSVKPSIPLLSLSRDLSPILYRTMYVGFSSSSGYLLRSAHYILGWSFRINGTAQDLIPSQLPRLPRIGPKPRSIFLTVWLPLILLSLLVVLATVVICVIRRKRKFAEVFEDWELDYGPHRFKYKDLYIATRGFDEKELLGTGGFGSVYRGVLPTSKTEIAVKRISHDSKQGMREFVSEIISIGRMSHRNLVRLLGYCRRKTELFLVYDYMSNGSLDKYIYGQPEMALNWRQRFNVIKGVASGLFYLHEEWEKVVIHRDVKASNVLLDRELNGRLGDFGLARLHDPGTDPQTTHVVGTLGYLAPELTKIGKFTTSTDVFAFGAFLLEVACGRRPIELRGPPENLVLVDWVVDLLQKGDIMKAVDNKLGTEYVKEEVELVLKLGLICSHSEAAARPNMRQVIRYLEQNVPLPELSALGISTNGLSFAYGEGFEEYAMSYPSSMNTISTRSTLIYESLLSGGR